MSALNYSLIGLAASMLIGCTASNKTSALQTEPIETSNRLSALVPYSESSPPSHIVNTPYHGSRIIFSDHFPEQMRAFVIHNDRKDELEKLSSQSLKGDNFGFAIFELPDDPIKLHHGQFYARDGDGNQTERSTLSQLNK
jgi:hypothetical protein